MSKTVYTNGFFLFFVRELLNGIGGVGVGFEYKEKTATERRTVEMGIHSTSCQMCSCFNSNRFADTETLVNYLKVAPDRALKNKIQAAVLLSQYPVHLVTAKHHSLKIALSIAIRMNLQYDRVEGLISFSTL
eukprot:1913325-Amphidinium_carterae.1